MKHPLDFLSRDLIPGTKIYLGLLYSPIYNSTAPHRKDTWKGPTLEQFMRNCSLLEGLTLKKFMKDCLPWDRPHTGAGEECEEEGAAVMCDERTTTPIPPSPVLLGGRRR